jgi:hypothetical protein
MNKDILKIMLSIPDVNYYAEARRHVYIDEEHIVATDGAVLLAYEHNLDIEKPALIVNQRDKSGEIKADILIEGTPAYTGSFQYPDYHRVLNPGTVDVAQSDPFLIYTLYSITKKTGAVFNYVRYATLLKTLDKKIKVESYFISTDPGLPTTISGSIAEHKIHFVFMPLSGIK